MAWETADRISDKIIDVLRAEMQSPGFDPVEMFAGQMLAMKAMLVRTEGLRKPVELIAVEATIEICLEAMLAARPLT